MSNTDQRQFPQQEEDDPAVTELTNILLDTGLHMAAAGFGDVLPEATVVKINPDTYEQGNAKRNAWIEEHIDDTFTIEYDPRWVDDPHIYCLAEDEGDPKWLFIRKELIVISRPEREVAPDEAEEDV